MTWLASSSAFLGMLGALSRLLGGEVRFRLSSESARESDSKCVCVRKRDTCISIGCHQNLYSKASMYTVRGRH